MRNPLNGTIGWLRFAQEDGSDGTKWRSDVKQALECTQLALTFLQNLSMIYKLEAGRLEQHPSPTSLIDIVSNVEQVLRPQMSDGVAFRLLCDDLHKLSDVMCDASYLTHVLINLCQNAARFTTSGSVSLIARVSRAPGGVLSHNLRGRAVNVAFQVQDTGSGIAPKVQRELFNRYVSEGGLGIGLHLSQKLVKALGSTLAVISPSQIDQDGKPCGTTFEFTLECHEAVEEGNGSHHSNFSHYSAKSAKSSKSSKSAKSADRWGCTTDSDPPHRRGRHTDLNGLPDLEPLPESSFHLVKSPSQLKFDTGTDCSSWTNEEALAYIREHRVLVADDLRINRVLLDRIFSEKYSCSVQTVETAEEVLELLSRSCACHDARVRSPVFPGSCIVGAGESRFG